MQKKQNRKQVKIRISRIRFEELISLYEWLLPRYDVENSEEQFLYIHAKDMLWRLKDMEGYSFENTTINMTYPEAAAFFRLWNDVPLDNPYSGIVIKDVVNEIDRQTIDAELKTPYQKQLT